MRAPKVWGNLWHFLAFGFGSGLAKKAPGTWGTIAGLAVMPLLYLLPLAWALVFIAVASVFGVWLCGRVANDLGVHDHFVLFRILDILKPWPISVLDRNVGGGLGIMIDDMLAGLIAGALLYALWLAELPLLAG